MTVKSRLDKLEKTRKPAGRLYVVYDDKDHVIAHPGGYMTKAEFEKQVTDSDLVVKVVYVGVNLEKL